MKNKLHAISIRHPFANFIRKGEKDIEIRKWRTSFRGKLIIHASKQIHKGPFYNRATRDYMPANDPANRLLKYYPELFGAAIATAQLTLVREAKPQDKGRAMIEIQEGHYAWILTNIQKIEPIPLVGKMGIFKTELTINDLKYI